MAELPWGAATDPGRVRKANEDGVLAAPGVFAVADAWAATPPARWPAVALETVRPDSTPRWPPWPGDGRGPSGQRGRPPALARGSGRGHGHHAHAADGSASGPDGDRLVLANVGDRRAYLPGRR